MLKELRGTGDDGRRKEGEVDGEIGVGVGDLHKDVAGHHLNPQLFPALPDERLLLCLCGFHLAADKLPQRAPRLVLRPLADQKAVFLPDQGGDHFGGSGLLFYLAHGLFPDVGHGIGKRFALFGAQGVGGGVADCDDQQDPFWFGDAEAV